eukprot:CAMPEP_0194253628 /NCGR_PEP_ID=MMETSP0158-20130606/30278_1 /TAXON_ID=33649 /ORGANISM="Thalassionema nitzschioides, Strain L26-B" /LENGTH=329 /DNA_ID=CAMNT_0038991391 /DNA_START=176 /DNA_END=1165 /DNA_ORIENTATION=-
MIFIRQMTKELLDDGRVKFWKHDRKNDRWKQVDFRTVQDKVSHALRDSKGSSDSGLDLMMDYTKAANPAQTPLEPRAGSTLQLYQDMKQQQVEAQTLAQSRSRASSSILPQIEISTLEPRLRASMQHLQELNQKNMEDQRELVASAIQERRHNLNLASMANRFSTPPATLSMNPVRSQSLISHHIGGLSQYGLQSSLGPSPVPSLFENTRGRSLDSIINQSNTRGQQLSADDMLLHRMRHHSSGALGQFMNTPNAAVSAAFGGNSAIGTRFQNQRVQGTHRLRKNLETPTPDGSIGILNGQNFMERSLQKLKLQRMAELKLLEEHLRNT